MASLLLLQICTLPTFMSGQHPSALVLGLDGVTWGHGSPQWQQPSFLEGEPEEGKGAGGISG